MTHHTKPISPLRQRMIEDMTLRKLSPKTQSKYIRAVINLTRFLGRSPDTATPEELRRYPAPKQPPIDHTKGLESPALGDITL
jgi:integrase/recombinase XerD